jgi:deoxyribodipyrimidine photolyase-related protein
MHMAHRQYLKHIDRNIPKPDWSEHETVIVIMHDQLNLGCWPEWIRKEKPLLLFMEAQGKGCSLPYHKKKLTYVLSSQRHFALECHQAGYPVYYHAGSGHYDEELKRCLTDRSAKQVYFMMPSEWDSRERLRSVADDMSDQHTFTELENRFFLADPGEWSDKIEPGYRMEYFYREMRRRTGYLMNGDQPEGGEWNYDDQNREKLPKEYTVPEQPRTAPDEMTREVMAMVDALFPDHFGSTQGFDLAVTREQALERMYRFMKERLPGFGPYEDALAKGEDYLFHSVLSPYLNNGLLLPEEVCEAAIERYQRDKAPLNSVEGLIRQIIGWREYIRIYYEAMMPEVRETNTLDLKRSLPAFFWTGETDMLCVSEAIGNVKEHGYSHHIQRLMILSNISNLTESDPRELLRWFWFAYVDAYEWVVLPNVLGMSTFADGGILASKPYVSSGNYINKMSNYCRSCKYSITKKTGEKACPFNYLYWHFVDQQREAFEENGRVGFMVNMYEKKSDQNKKEIRESAQNFIESLARYNS